MRNETQRWVYFGVKNLKSCIVFSNYVVSMNCVKALNVVYWTYVIYMKKSSTHYMTKSLYTRVNLHGQRTHFKVMIIIILKPGKNQSCQMATGVWTLALSTTSLVYSTLKKWKSQRKSKIFKMLHSWSHLITGAEIKSRHWFGRKIYKTFLYEFRSKH